MSSPLIQLESIGHIRVLRLNDPARRNAMTEAMGDALREAVSHLKADADARVAVITGRGSAFSAGGDLDMLRANTTRPAEDVRQSMRAFYPRFLSLRDLEIPTVAAINGAAIGAGLCVALACDIRVAADEARLAVNFGRLGLSPGMAATWLLPRLAGSATALELLLTGDTVTAQQAAQRGWINHAWSAEAFWPNTLELAGRIARNAPVANRQAKQLVYANASRDLAAALDAEAAAQAITFATADMREGLDALAQKREPDFKGR